MLKIKTDVRVGGGERNEVGRICEHWTKIPVKTSQSRKESILNCLLIGSGGFIYKSKGGIRSTRSDQEITDLIEVGQKALAGNNCCRSENSGSLLGWTYNYLEERLNNGSLFETTLSWLVKNIVTQKEGIWACTTIIEKKDL